jgi:hypothetical protein
VTVHHQMVRMHRVAIHKVKAAKVAHAAKVHGTPAPKVAHPHVAAYVRHQGKPKIVRRVH